MFQIERSLNTRRAGLITVIGVLLVPLVVAAGFLGATWNSQNRLNTVQAAVVNLDQPIKLNGQTVPLGRQLSGALVDGSDDANGSKTSGTSVDTADPSKNFDWVLSDVADAKDGLDSGKYAAVVTIPKEFSANATSYAKNKAADAQHATLQVQTSAITGVTDPAIAQAIAATAVRSVNQQLTEGYLKNVYLGFNQTAKQFTTVATAAGDLSDGTSSLSKGIGKTADGSKAFADGLDKLSTGAGQLSTGVGGLDTGAAKLATGFDTLAKGTRALPGQATQLADGVDASASGAKKLATGAKKLDTGTATFAAGTKKNAAGLKTYAGGAQKYADGVDTYGSGAKTYATGVGQYAAGAKKNATGVKAYAGGAKAYAAGAQTAADNTKAFSQGVAQAYAGLTTAMQAQIQAICANPGITPAQCAHYQSTLAKTLAGVFRGTPKQPGQTAPANPGLIKSSAQLSGGIQQLATGADGLSGGAGQLSAGATGLSTGATKLAGGATALSSGAAQLSGGADALSSGAGQLSSGATKINTGAQGLSSGVHQISGGVSALSGGLTKLADGTDQLATGLGTLNSGIQKTDTGVDQLAAGVHKLAPGASALAAGVKQAATGGDSLHTGLVQLDSGGEKLAAGSKKLADGLKKGAAQIPTYTANDRTVLSSVVASPVNAERPDTLFSNQNTSTLLAVLGLWLGALVSYLVFRAVSWRAFGSSKSSARLALEGVVPGAAVAAIQAVVVSLALWPLLDLSAAQVGKTLGFTLLAGIAFVVVNQALVAWFGGIGRFISAVALGLAAAAALTSALPGFFDVVRPFLPMTPALDGLRAIVTGGSGTGHAVGVLLAWLVVGAAASVIAVVRRRMVPAGAGLIALAG